MHRHLVKMPFTAFLTTHFDPCLATAAAQPGVTVRPVQSYPLLQAADLRRGHIYYLHGRAWGKDTQGDPSGMVLTESDYEEAYHAESSALRPLLTDLFSDQTVLFIAVSLGDPGLSEILGVARPLAQQPAHMRGGGLRTADGLILSRHFWLQPEVLSEADPQAGYPRRYEEALSLGREVFLEESGISVIRYEVDDQHYSGLEAILQDLYRMCGDRPLGHLEEDAWRTNSEQDL